MIQCLLTGRTQILIFIISTLSAFLNTIFQTMILIYLSYNDSGVKRPIRRPRPADCTLDLCKRLLHDGEETLKSWKPLLNTIFAFRGSSECPVQQSAHKPFVPSAGWGRRMGLLTPESYDTKKELWFLKTITLFYETYRSYLFLQPEDSSATLKQAWSLLFLGRLFTSSRPFRRLPASQVHLL